MQAETSGQPGRATAGAGGVPPPAVRVGVLFVHGIGMQKRGETLTAAGEAIHAWFRDWFSAAAQHKPPATVALEETVLLPSSGDPDAPPHTWLRIRRGDGGPDAELLLAESHWADSFPMPRFSEVARWALLVLPWTIATQFALRLRRVLAVYPHRLRFYPLIALELLAYVGAFFLSAAVELLVLALLVFAVVPIPRFRDFVVGLQLKIAAVVGDSYVLLRSPVRESAIVSRVVRDVRWLAERGCERCALVAHSQGGAVAHRVAASAADPKLERLKLLFTFGSGLGKLRDIEANSSRPNLLWAGWLVLVPILVATLLTPGQLHLLMTDPEAVQRVPLPRALAAAIAPVAAIVALWLLDMRMSTSRSGLVPAGRDGVRPMWVDRHASQDPVPAGPLLDEPDPGIDSALVFNRHAVWSDHTSYWQNQDGFVTEVARQLAAVAELPLTAPAAEAREAVDESLAAAAPRRRWRVWWLTGVRVAVVLGALALAWVLHHQGALAALGGEIAGGISRLAAAPGGLLAAVAPAAGEAAGETAREATGRWASLWRRHGDTLLGVAAVFLLSLLVYGLAYRAWQWWGRRDLVALHACARRDAGGAAFATLIGLALALPALSILVALAGAGRLVGALAEYAAWPREVHAALFVALLFSFATGAFFVVQTWADSDEDDWRTALPTGLFALLLALTIEVPAAWWLGVRHPRVLRPEPGAWGLSGLGVLWGMGAMLVPGLLAWLWLRFAWRPLLGWLRRRARYRPPPGRWGRALRAVAASPSRLRTWLAERSVRGPVRSHPVVAPHPVGTTLAISAAAAGLALAASWSLHRGWIGAWGLALFAAAALVATLTAWSLRQRVEERSPLHRLAGVLLWVPYWALFLAESMRWF